MVALCFYIGEGIGQNRNQQVGYFTDLWSARKLQPVHRYCIGYLWKYYLVKSKIIVLLYNKDNSLQQTKIRLLMTFKVLMSNLCNQDVEWLKQTVFNMNSVNSVCLVVFKLAAWETAAVQRRAAASSSRLPQRHWRRRGGGGENCCAAPFWPRPHTWTSCWTNAPVVYAGLLQGQRTGAVRVVVSTGQDDEGGGRLSLSSVWNKAKKNCVEAKKYVYTSCFRLTSKKASKPDVVNRTLLNN